MDRVGSIFKSRSRVSIQLALTESNELDELKRWREWYKDALEAGSLVLDKQVGVVPGS